MDALVFYCSKCKQTFVGREYKETDRPLCPNCNQRTQSTGIIKETWVEMSKEERQEKIDALVQQEEKNQNRNKEIKLYTNTLENVTPIRMLTATATYGIGFLTFIVKAFCDLFGTSCEMYTNKLDKAELEAREYLKVLAKDIGADGIMDVRCQIDGLTFFICGTAYIEN